MTTPLPRRPAKDNDMTTSRMIAVLEAAVDRMLLELDGADERQQVALMTLIAKHQRRIVELRWGRPSQTLRQRV
jgi:hypothetical protein